MHIVVETFYTLKETETKFKQYHSSKTTAVENQITTEF